MIITIDGPAVSGKGTMAKALGVILGIPHLDTGLLYRRQALIVMHAEGVDPQDETAVLAAMDAGQLSADAALVDIRSERVGRVASIISAHPGVRQRLFDQQVQFSQRPEGAILDGRDCGSLIAPQADVKLFVTADLSTRAQRVRRDLERRRVVLTANEQIEPLRAAIAERDAREMTRSVAPLVRTDDAVPIDTSLMTIPGMIESALNALRPRVDVDARVQERAAAILATAFSAIRYPWWLKRLGAGRMMCGRQGVTYSRPVHVTTTPDGTPVVTPMLAAKLIGELMETGDLGVTPW